MSDPQPEQSPAAAVSRRPMGLREGTAIVLLLIGGFLVLIGWFVGVALLLGSSRWTAKQKLRGILILPFGWLPALFLLDGGSESCPAPAPTVSPVARRIYTYQPGVHCGGLSTLAILTFAVAVILPLITTVALTRAAIRPVLT